MSDNPSAHYTLTLRRVGLAATLILSVNGFLLVL